MRFMSRRQLLSQGASLVALSFMFCSHGQAETVASSAAPAVSPAALAIPAGYQDGWGFDQAGMDQAVVPGDNFFDYANGTYLKKLQIPADMSSYGPFRILYQLSLARQRLLLDEAVQQTPASVEVPTDETGKLGVYYASFMNEAHVNQLGAAPLKADLNEIHQVHDAASLAHVFGQAAHSLMFSTFALGIEQDQADPSRYMLVLDQGMSIGINGGLGLPDISYYTDPKLAPKKQAYEAYIARMLELSGWAAPHENAQAVVALETALAKVELPRDQTRDPLKTFNPMPVSELVRLAPQVDWRALLLSMGVPEKGLDKRVINVREPKAIGAMAQVLASTDWPVLQAWLAFHLADNAAPYLSNDFSNASFAFNGRVLNGIAEQPARWKRGVNATNQAMGWALGRVYVARFFPPEAQERITSLVGELKAAFHLRLEQNQWMDAPTRKAALKKLDHFAMQVGYPKKWWDYSALVVRREDVYGNATRGVAFNWNHELSRLDKPVDRDEWSMTPQTVNAYNDPTMNEIVFPAAILQPPFFDPKGDMAVNYGGIGGVIGHEMSHAFDDQGRHYDADGRLHDWWTKKSTEAFDKLAARLGAQYDKVEVLPGLYVNGKMTMGENIADLGGLNLGLQAYRDSLGGKTAPKLYGWTGDQRVFLGWAQVWREKYRPDALRRLVLSNEHAPPLARTNMPAHNIDAWYQAFHVEPGQKLYLPPAQRVKIW